MFAHHPRQGPHPRAAAILLDRARDARQAAPATTA